MKIRVQKEIINGILKVSVFFEEPTIEEQTLFEKYGEPIIDLGGTLEKIYLDPPVLTYPNNSAENIPINVDLTWETVEGAISYNIEIADNSSFNNSSIYTTSNTSYTFSLNNETNYYWRVAATDSIGTGSWSNSRIFTTIAATPNIPTLITPLEGATDVPLNIEFTWTEQSYLINPITWDIQISIYSDFSTILDSGLNLTNPNFTSSLLENDTQYYWRVRAKNLAGTSNWSSYSSFITVIPVPSAPALLTPIENFANASANPAFDWLPSAHADSYEIVISVGLIDYITQGNLVNTSFTVPVDFELTNLQTYTWKVRAKNTQGYSDWSEVRSFTVDENVTLSAPILISPINTEINVNPYGNMVYWEHVENADEYLIQLSSVSDFSSIISEGSPGTNSSELTDMQENTVYYWRVKAVSATFGDSDWSDVFSFTTGYIYPTTPTLSFPSDGATNVEETQELIWNVASRADTYTLQIASDSGFTSIISTQANITKTAYTFTGSSATTYYWRVRSHNIYGDSAYSSGRSFTVENLSPSTPVLDSPSDSSTSLFNSVNFLWNVVDKAVSYDIQIASDSGFNTIISSATNLVETYYNYTFTANGVYYWRVRANNTYGSSSYTAGRTLTINAVLAKNPLEVGLTDVWLRGDDLTMASSAVASANDKSGNGRHFTNATTGNRPITEVINTRTFIKFDGSLTDVRNLSVADSGHLFKMTGTEVRTFAMVVKIGANTTGRYNTFFSRSNNNVGDEYFFRLPTNFGSSPSYNYFSFPKSDATLNEVLMPDNQGGIHLVILEANGTQCKIYVDGVLISQRTVTFPSVSLPANASTLFVLGGGRQPNATQGTFNGSIGDFSTGSKVLSATEVLQLTKYYQEYYGVTNYIGEYAPTTVDRDLSYWLSNIFGAQPSAGRTALLNTFISGLKSDGVYSKLDGLWVMAAETQEQANLNFIRNKPSLVPINSPTFTADLGYTTNGTNQYLRTGTSPKYQYNASQNSMSYGLYVNTSVNQNAVDMGVAYGSYCLLYTNLGGAMYTTINDAGSTPSTAISTSVGFSVIDRYSSSTYKVLKNGINLSTQSFVSTGVSEFEFFIGARNLGGTPDRFASKRYAVAFVGRGLTDPEHLSFYNRVNTLLTAIGAN